MTTSWNPDLLNRYVAPSIAEFSEASIPELELEGEKVEHCMANYFLNSVFRGEYAGPLRQFAFNIIYRAQACFESYHDASIQTRDFLVKSSPRSPKTLTYYRALRAWENCFLNLQTFVDLINRAVKMQVFQQDDGSPEQRAYAIANSIKHWGHSIARGEHNDDDTVPVWLTNDGFVTRSSKLSYDELAGLLREAAKVVEDLRDPSTRAQPTA